MFIIFVETTETFTFFKRPKIKFLLLQTSGGVVGKWLVLFLQAMILFASFGRRTSAFRIP